MVWFVITEMLCSLLAGIGIGWLLSDSYHRKYINTKINIKMTDGKKKEIYGRIES